MQAIASSTSERMPIMCEGSNFSNGNRKPVALVRMVKSRNIAVRPGIRFEVRSPNMTIMQETIAIKLMITCTVVKVDRLIPRIMTRSPFLIGRCYDRGMKITTGAELTATIPASSRDQQNVAMPSFFAPLSQTAPALLPHLAIASLAIEKFHQFRDHLVRRFFHQPMSAVFDKHALDVGRYHLALLDQERPAGFFARKHQQRHRQLGLCKSREVLGVLGEGAENFHPGGHVAGMGRGLG